MPTEQRTLTKEFKREAVRLVQTSAKRTTHFARGLGIAQSTLHHRWNVFVQQGEQVFPPKVGHQTEPEEEIRRGVSGTGDHAPGTGHGNTVEALLTSSTLAPIGALKQPGTPDAITEVRAIELSLVAGTTPPLEPVAIVWVNQPQMALPALGCLSSVVKSRLILTAILTATPTNIREKQRSTMNDEPFRPASGGRRRTQANGIHRVPPSALPFSPRLHSSILSSNLPGNVSPDHCFLPVVCRLCCQFCCQLRAKGGKMTSCEAR